MKIKIYNQFNPELKVFWNILEGKSYHFIFQRFDWLSTWQKYIGSQKFNIKPYIILVLDNNDNPLLIFPLGQILKYKIKIITFLGGGQSDYNFPLIDNSLITKNSLLIDLLVKIKKKLPNYDILHFDKFPEKVSENFNPFLRLLNFKSHDIAYYREIPKTVDDFEKNLRSKLRTDTKRQIRRLNNLPGELKVDLENILNDNKKGIEAMISQKKKKYIQSNVPNIFQDRDVEGFYLNLHKYLKGDASIHFSVLKFNNKYLSTHWGAIHNKRFYFLMPSYEFGEYAVYSPGKILLYQLMIDSINNNLEIFDFTIGAEQYKKDWCNKSILLYEYMDSNTFKGYLFMVFIKLKRFIKKSSFLFSLTKKIYGFKNKF
tara:strand:- start:1260 stop:2375 length:1116 start_codon:yes stop_codon:yes gene_type:complete